jgi:hypothetical protein
MNHGMQTKKGKNGNEIIKGYKLRDKRKFKFLELLKI